MSINTTRLTFDMPVSEHKRLKALAALRGVSLKKLVLSCIHETLYSSLSLNEETVKSLKETDEGKGLTKHKDVDDMLKNFGISE